MNLREAICVITTLISLCAATAMAQSGGTFTDRGNKFSIALSKDWRASHYTDAVGRKRTEFVHGDRGRGLLRISKETPGKRTLDQVIDRELEGLRAYHGKYLLSGRDSFEGEALRGIRVSFHYIERGHQATAAYYYLEDVNSVWVLRFTARVGSLDAYRNATDEIARSFRPK